MRNKWKILVLVLSSTIALWIFYRPKSRPEITLATVNNADMILMQQLSSEFEKKSGVKLNWVVLGENALRQRLTIDIATGSDTFDVITIGSYEAPLWGEREWILPLDDLGGLRLWRPSRLKPRSLMEPDPSRFFGISSYLIYCARWLLWP
jgi:ABC-type glycerol-3-phosphate transport system substrate-binding protein